MDNSVLKKLKMQKKLLSKNKNIFYKYKEIPIILALSIGISTYVCKGPLKNKYTKVNNYYSYTYLTDGTINKSVSKEKEKCFYIIENSKLDDNLDKNTYYKFKYKNIDDINFNKLFNMDVETIKKEYQLIDKKIISANYFYSNEINFDNNINYGKCINVIKSYKELKEKGIIDITLDYFIYILFILGQLGLYEYIYLKLLNKHNSKSNLYNILKEESGYYINKTLKLIDNNINYINECGNNKVGDLNERNSKGK